VQESKMQCQMKLSIQRRLRAHFFAGTSWALFPS
jgi:hypothetical protein